MKLEILQKDKFYHIYNRGINGCNIFSSNENKSYFLKLVSKYLNIDFVDFRFSSYQNIVNNSELLVNKSEVINLFDDVDNFKYCHNSKKKNP